jgi:hypothetical protein
MNGDGEVDLVAVRESVDHIAGRRGCAGVDEGVELEYVQPTGAVEDVLARAADKRVVALTTIEVVIAAEAHEDVLAGAADDDVAERIADAVDVASAQQREVLLVAVERPAHPGVDPVDSRSGRDDVAGVDVVEGVVAVAADKLVYTGPAVEGVVAVAAAQRVVAKAAR